MSLGLALATWVRRIGRSVALSVIVCFLGGLVWPVLVNEVVQSAATDSWISNNRWLTESLEALSPMQGAMAPLTVFQWNQGKGTPFWVSLGVVIVVKAAAAGFLLWVTIKTFDRCLGRVPWVALERRDRRSPWSVDRIASRCRVP